MPQQKPQYDKYGFPVDSPVSPDTSYQRQVPWQFGIKQKIQAKKIRASTGQFHNLSGTLSPTITSINAGIIQNSLVEAGTVANNLMEGGTLETCLFTNGTAGTIQITGGTANNQIIGTPQIIGGTAGTMNLIGGTSNAGTYLVGGVPGVSGSIVYIKTVSPGTTMGTLSFSAGLITGFS